MNKTRTFSPDQKAIVDELCQVHSDLNIEPSQISFDGDSLTPIFDYEANSALSVKLTDIKTLDCEITNRDKANRVESVAACTVILPDGRSRTVEDSAMIGEQIAPGVKIETIRDADGVAQNRASRRGIRSVGVNIWNAHKAFLKTGEVAAGSTEEDPRARLVKQIHALSDELGLSKEEYQELMAAGYGRSSSTDLNELELVSFARLLRSMKRIQVSRQANADEYKDAA